jgi:hypothetical protein
MAILSPHPSAHERLTVDGDAGALTIPQSTLESALLEHLTQRIFDNPEQRDELIRELVKSVLSTPDRFRNGQTFIQTYVREGIAEGVKQIAKEWIEAHSDIIRAQVEEALTGNIVGVIVSDMATVIADRLKRGY